MHIKCLNIILYSQPELHWLFESSNIRSSLEIIDVKISRIPHFSLTDLQRISDARTGLTEQYSTRVLWRYKTHQLHRFGSRQRVCWLRPFVLRNGALSRCLVEINGRTELTMDPYPWSIYIWTRVYDGCARIVGA